MNQAKEHAESFSVHQLVRNPKMILDAAACAPVFIVTQKRERDDLVIIKKSLFETICREGMPKK